jgi:hypothetical protein
MHKCAYFAVVLVPDNEPVRTKLGAIPAMQRSAEGRGRHMLTGFTSPPCFLPYFFHLFMLSLVKYAQMRAMLNGYFSIVFLWFLPISTLAIFLALRLTGLATKDQTTCRHFGNTHVRDRANAHTHAQRA